LLDQVTALANKKFPGDEDCTTYGQVTDDIFSIHSRALTSTSSYLSNQDAPSRTLGDVRNSERSLEEKMWSAMDLDSPSQPLPLVQKRENFYY